MAFEVEDRLYIRLKFAGEEFPFMRVNSVNFLHMSASSKIGIPMFHMSLNDPDGYLEKEKLLGDGIPIEISVAPSPTSKIVHTHTFRMNTPRKKHSTPNTVYELDGYLDKPKYWHNSTSEYTEGLASDVLSKIADSCDLEYDGESTNDFQVWWPGNRRNFQWAWHVAQRAYISETACLQLALDFDGKLLLKDVNKLDTVDHRMTYMEPRKDHILATDVEPDANSGTQNHIGGYKVGRVYQKLMKNAEEFNVYDDAMEVEPTTGEKSFLRNKVLTEGTEKATVFFAPLDFGAVNPMYERAKYQNSRMDGLFSLNLVVVTPEATEVKLFQNIEIFLNYPEDPASPRYSRHMSGIYKVVSKTIYVHGSNYYERFTLSRRAYGEETAEN